MEKGGCFSICEECSLYGWGEIVKLDGPWWGPLKLGTAKSNSDAGKERPGRTLGKERGTWLPSVVDTLLTVFFRNTSKILEAERTVAVKSHHVIGSAPSSR